MDGEGGLVVVLGALQLALIGVDEAQAAELAGLAQAVADLAPDCEGGLVVFLGALRCALQAVDEAQVAEGVGLALSVSSSPAVRACLPEIRFCDSQSGLIHMDQTEQVHSRSPQGRNPGRYGLSDRFFALTLCFPQLAGLPQAIRDE